MIKLMCITRHMALNAAHAASPAAWRPRASFNSVVFVLTRYLQYICVRN